MFRGDVFERVSFVQDRHLILRQKAFADLLESQVDEEQRVIDDEHIGAEHLLARLEIEALLKVLALLAEAVVTVAFDEVPDTGMGTEVEVALAAVAGLLGPDAEGVKLLVRRGLGEQTA